MVFDSHINSGNYGIESIVKNYCGLKKYKHIIGNWQHGVIFPETVYHPYQLVGNEIPIAIKKFYPFFVATQDFRLFLSKNRYCNVRAIGLPILYAENSSTIRQRDSILLLPNHGVDINLDIWKKLKFTEVPKLNAYFEFAKSICKNFEKATITFHKNDFNEQNIKLFSQISNLKIVKGGDPNDQDSITRLVELYKSHEYATSNVLQSALIYAGFFGCKISICGPPALDYLIKVSAWLSILGKSEELNQKIADGFRKADENCNFLKLREHSLRESQQHIEWCSKLLGSDFKMSPDELRKALGLSRLNLIKKYTVHYTMKSARLIDKLCRFKFP